MTLRTSNLYLSAFLITSGMRLEGSSLEGGKVVFVFEAHRDMGLLKRVYYNKTGKIPACEYAENIRTLKKRVHEEMRDG